MKGENKYNRTVRKENLEIGMEYTIKEIKFVATKYGKKIVIIIDSKGEMVYLFAPKRFNNKAADLEMKILKLDKGMI